MKFQPSGFERESHTSQRILRVALMVGMGVAQGLISAVMLLMAINGMGVRAQVVLVGRQQDLVPRQQDDWASDLAELNPDGLMKIVDLNSASKKEEELSQPESRCALTAIGQ